MKYHVEIQEQGNDDWLEFTETPLEEDQADCMCQTLEKNYPKFKTRKVSEVLAAVANFQQRDYMMTDAQALAGNRNLPKIQSKTLPKP